jgi:hypothetical protein
LHDVVDYSSVGGESNALLFVHAQTEWMTVENEFAQKILQHDSFIGSQVDVNIKGMSLGSSKSDVTLKVIDKIGITKRGDKYLQTLLVHGARTVMANLGDKQDRLSQWCSSILKRRGHEPSLRRSCS